jgi:MbtH protein
MIAGCEDRSPSSCTAFMLGFPCNVKEKITMSLDNTEDSTIYRVVINDEEQYSIWPVSREIPLGWRDAGRSGLKAECLDYIKEVWTDMRPLSLRRKMESEEVTAAPAGD